MALLTASSEATRSHDKSELCLPEAPTALDSGQQDQPYSAFSKTQKRLIVLMIAFAGFFSPFSAFVYFPAIGYIAADLQVSVQLINITITTYLIVQGIAPAFFGDLADQLGRRPVCLFVLTVYFLACVGLALQRSYAALLVLRMLQSCGSSGTISLGVMVVADIAPPQVRGSYIGAMLTGPNTGPSIGPVIGGLIADSIGWPWIFWVLSIVAGFCPGSFVLRFPETCRNVVGDGSKTVGPLNKALFGLGTVTEGSSSHSDELGAELKRVPNPFACLRLIARAEDALVLASNATFYMNYSCIQASLAHLMTDRYQLNGFSAGLCYLAYGIATLTSSFAVGKVIDWDYRATAKSHGIVVNKDVGHDFHLFPIEKAQIRSIWYFLCASIVSTVVYAWTVELGVHLNVLLVMQFICGLSTTGVFNVCLTLYIDLHPKKPGVTSVIVSLTRCLVAAAGVAVLEVMLQSIGIGWAFTVYTSICCTSIPMLLIVRTYGGSWRIAHGER